MKALLLIDVQKDFLSGGALAVAQGDEVIPVANRLMPEYELVVATQDWHPPDHGSFAGQHPGRHIGEMIKLNGLNQILWPVHCVQGSAGAATPGLTDESIVLFLAEGLEKEGPGGGDEREDIKIHEVALRDVTQWLNKNDADLKLLAGLYLAQQEMDSSDRR